jgi:soluble epoxide hydrolase/lipid-phosphate phosphatase
MIVWRMCQYFPEVVKAVASTCIHYIPPSEQFIDLEALIQLVPDMEYMVHNIKLNFKFSYRILERYWL